MDGNLFLEFKQNPMGHQLSKKIKSRKSNKAIDFLQMKGNPFSIGPLKKRNISSES